MKDTRVSNQFISTLTDGVAIAMRQAVKIEGRKEAQSSSSSSSLDFGQARRDCICAESALRGVTYRNEQL
jgi:hypothetical protein